jgi:hypothetical protein
MACGLRPSRLIGLLGEVVITIKIGQQVKALKGFSAFGPLFDERPD